MARLAAICGSPPSTPVSTVRARAGSRLYERSPPGDAPDTPSPEASAKAVESPRAAAGPSLAGLAKQQEEQEQLRRALKSRLARALEPGVAQTRDAIQSLRSDSALEAPSPTPGEPRSNSPPRYATVDEPASPHGTSTRDLEDQIRRMREEWAREREMWTKLSESGVEEAARSSAQEAEKMLEAWRKAAAKGRERGSQQRVIVSDTLQSANSQTRTKKMDANTQTSDANAEISNPAREQTRPACNVADAGSLSITQLTKQQLQQDQMRRALMSKVALALDPRTTQKHRNTADEVNRKICRLESRIAHMQEEQARERAAWQEAKEAAIRQMQEDAEVALEQDREKATVRATAFEAELARSHETVAALEKTIDDQAAELRAQTEFAQRLTDQLARSQETVIALQRTSDEQAAQLSAQTENAQRMIGQLQSLLGKNGKLEQHMAKLEASHEIGIGELQTELSEVTAGATRLQGAMRDLTHTAATERANYTHSLSRLAVHNACRHAVRTHESRKEIIALSSRHQAELAALEASLEGGIELDAFLHATASDIDNEYAQQRLLASVAQKFRLRGVMKSLHTWRDFVKYAQARRYKMRVAAKRLRMLVAVKIFGAWADVVNGRKTAVKLTECVKTQDKMLATALVDRVFSAALVRDATQTTTKRVLVAATQKKRHRAVAKCVNTWRYVVLEQATARCKMEQTTYTSQSPTPDVLDSDSTSLAALMLRIAGCRQRLNALEYAETTPLL